MNAKYSLLLSAFLVFFTLHVVDAQQPAKIPTLGYLSQYSGPAGPKSPSLEAFLRGLTELGYVEGKNIAIEYRYTEGKNDRLPALAAELVSQKVDIIVTETGGAAVEAKKATQTIPIVMEGSGDAVATRIGGKSRPSRRERHRPDFAFCGRRSEAPAVARGAGAESHPCGGPLEADLWRW